MISSVSKSRNLNKVVIKKGKDKNKDMVSLVDERLAKINDYMATLTSSVDDMDKRIEEPKSMGEFEGLLGDMQAVVNSMIAGVNKEIQEPWASEATNDAKL